MPFPPQGSAFAPQEVYYYKDQDPDHISPSPVVKDTWYEVFDEEDVRLLYCRLQQTNDEAAAKNIVVKWTEDGNPYQATFSVPNNSVYAIWQIYLPSPAGLSGGTQATANLLACRYTDKRAQSFKVEIQMTSNPGTNQTMECWCKRETWEVT